MILRAILERIRDGIVMSDPHPQYSALDLMDGLRRAPEMAIGGLVDVALVSSDEGGHQSTHDATMPGDPGATGNASLRRTWVV